jgi:hypothetical protein
MQVAPTERSTTIVSVDVRNADGTPLTTATVLVAISMVEMDMGTQLITLTPTSQPGSYRGEGILNMAGHWRLDTTIQPAGQSGPGSTTTFMLAIGSY